MKNQSQVRWFASWEEYKNVGKVKVFDGYQEVTVVDPTKNYSKVTGLNSAQTQRLRQAIEQKLDDEIRELESAIQTLALAAQHPLAKLLEDLKRLREIFTHVRVEIVNKEGSIAASYNPISNTIMWPLANDTIRNFEDELDGLVEFIFEESVHELDHALTDNVYHQGWVDATQTYVFADNTQCTADVTLGANQLLSTDPRVKTGYTFQLDFSQHHKGQNYVYDSRAENYQNYPVRISDQESCVPDEFFTSRLANEVHAYQVEGRYLLFTYFQLELISAEDLKKLGDENITAAELKAIAQRISANITQRGRPQMGDVFYTQHEDHLMHYLGCGQNTQTSSPDDILPSSRNGEYQIGDEDIQDYYEHKYTYITQMDRHPEGCAHPKL